MVRKIKHRDVLASVLARKPKEGLPGKATLRYGPERSGDTWEKTFQASGGACAGALR